MLELKNIVKDYPAGEDIVQALKGIDLKFRDSEFVSILGPSGCGKTTLLNIIGGLDQYTSGDLVINGKSTKEFNGKNWDTYRNHSVGFVFQSYNLIPHQTVLQNVELALTVSGVSKSERKARAIKALEDVGLGNQLNKRPSQMSGGQMQRVAIARALVNNPEIILADEPTGALDTETSVQVMEILKEISKDRLIVMVTHNPELAEQYSSRIIRMLDGNIISDSSPIEEEEYESLKLHCEEKAKVEEGKKKPSMSFWTAFKLSLKNLFTKKGRTLLTAFAGSIGIIGIALILAVSQGMTGYIDRVQEQTLSTYPVTIEATTTDFTAMISSFMKMGQSEVDHDSDAVYKKSIIYELANVISGMDKTENDLKSFKTYLDSELEKEDSKLNSAIAGVQYTYDLDLLVYTKNQQGEIMKADANELMAELLSQYLGADFSQMNSSGGISLPFGTMSANVWQELLPGKNGDPINDLIKSQYDVVYGTLPNSYDEIVLILDENNELDDMSLYVLGLLDKSIIDEVVEAIKNNQKIEFEEQSWSYEEICGKECRVILNSNCYNYLPDLNIWTDLRNSETGLNILYNNALKLKITGIIKPNKNATTNMLSGSIGYISDLTKYVISQSSSSEAVQAQLVNNKTDIFTGLPFKSNIDDLTDEQKESDFRAYVNRLNTSAKAKTYVKVKSTLTDEELSSQTDALLSSMTREYIISLIVDSMKDMMSQEQINKYLQNMSDDDIKALIRPSVEEQIQLQYATKVKQQLDNLYPTDEEKAIAFDEEMKEYTTEQCAFYYDNVIIFSESTYEDNLNKLGYIDLSNPASISIYASSFENKAVITDAISEYNQTVAEEKQIKYTDYVGLIMSSVTQIINAITYVLIAFVAISLIVSSIMVGVITLISVQERTKEIGILRAIGASKRDVSSMFNAETLIIGFASGLFGVIVTYLLCIPINIILHALTGIGDLSAILNPVAALILVLISMGLTVISGLIPSRSAAKKDPVVALRTE